MKRNNSRKRCIICGSWYTPNPRTAETQKACSLPRCRKERKRLADKSWRERNPDWFKTRQPKVRLWSAGYPAYWRKYRAAHPEYRARERERMLLYRVLSVAKQDVIRANPVEYLRGMRCFGAKTVAKQDAIALRLDGVVEYLLVLGGVAKPNDMVARPPP